MNITLKKYNKKVLLTVLGILIAIGPLTIDVYLPAFLQISQSFKVPASQVQLTLTFYFLGFSVNFKASLEIN